MLINKVIIEKPLTVQEIRMLLGLTQQSFSDKLNMALSTYVRKEYGETSWKFEELKAVSEISGVPLMMILEK